MAWSRTSSGHGRVDVTDTAEPVDAQVGQASVAAEQPPVVRGVSGWHRFRYPFIQKHFANGVVIGAVKG